MQSITVTAEGTILFEENTNRIYSNAYFTADIPEETTILKITVGGQFLNYSEAGIDQTFIDETQVNKAFSNIVIDNSYASLGSFPISATPKNNKGGRVSFIANVTIEYKLDYLPEITIGIPSTTKISSIVGHDQAIVTFQSDRELQSWEARATLPEITPAHGVGLLVESGGSLAANTDATVYVDDEELTQGDQEYTITVHGHGSNGYWSDGTYENSNVLGSPISLNNASYTNGILTCETTGNTNVNSMYVQLLSYLNSTLISSLVRTEEKQNVFFDFELNTSTVNKIRLKLNGNNQDGYAEFDLSNIENGYYQISYNITELQLNLAVIQDIKMTKAVV